MFCLLLVVLFAGLQGTGLYDRIQHSATGEKHGHDLLSAATMEAGHLDRGASHDERDDDAAPAGEAGPDGSGSDTTGPAHHHHHADHGSSLPVPYPAQYAVLVAGSARPGIPQVAAVPGSGVHALERPPKMIPAAA